MHADSVNIQPGETWGRNSYWNIEGDATKAKICEISAEFYDGTTWNNSWYNEWRAAEQERFEKG